MSACLCFGFVVRSHFFSILFLSFFVFFFFCLLRFFSSHVSYFGLFPSFLFYHILLCTFLFGELRLSLSNAASAGFSLHAYNVNPENARWRCLLSLLLSLSLSLLTVVAGVGVGVGVVVVSSLL